MIEGNTNISIAPLGSQPAVAPAQYAKATLSALSPDPRAQPPPPHRKPPTTMSKKTQTTSKSKSSPHATMTQLLHNQ